MPVGEFNEGKGDGQVKSAGACAAGVQVSGVLFAFDPGAVGVTADDEIDVRRSWIEIKIGKGVQYVDELAGELKGFRGRECGAGAVDIDVAANGGDRRDTVEFFQNGRVADIPGVDDVIDSGERCDRLRAQEPVGCPR